jgi:hypothetical protein
MSTNGNGAEVRTVGGHSGKRIRTRVPARAERCRWGERVGAHGYGDGDQKYDPRPADATKSGSQRFPSRQTLTPQSQSSWANAESSNG